MSATFKWIAGMSLAMLLALAGLAFGGSVMAEQPGDEDIAETESEPQPRIDFKPAIAAKIAGDMERRANEPFVIKRILPIEGPMKYGDWHWDTEDVPEKGRLVMTVDLEARVISVFRDGYEIGAAVAMLGTEAHPTPTGKFPILWKQRHNVSEKYGNAPMPWSMFLTTDGIAIHGGSEVENGYASHGCIAVPDPFADRLFDIAKEGDVVIITDGKRIGMGDSLI